MSEDTRPPPRLPLDTASYAAVKEGTLDGFITFEPGESIYLTALLGTQTEKKWVSAWDRAVYDARLPDVFPDQGTAESVIRPVLREFGVAEPRPPQTQIGKVLT